MNTGLHKVGFKLGFSEVGFQTVIFHVQVSDIYCNCCDCYLGWRYEEAFEQSQKYKENKVVLEKARMTREEWTM